MHASNLFAFAVRGMERLLGKRITKGDPVRKLTVLRLLGASSHPAGLSARPRLQCPLQAQRVLRSFFNAPAHKGIMDHAIQFPTSFAKLEVGKGVLVQIALPVVDEDSDFEYHNSRARVTGRHIIGVVRGAAVDPADKLYGCRNAGCSTMIARALIISLKFRTCRRAVPPEGTLHSITITRGLDLT